MTTTQPSPSVYFRQRESLIDCRRVSGDDTAVVVANESIHRQGVIIPFASALSPTYYYYYYYYHVRRDTTLLLLDVYTYNT